VTDLRISTQTMGGNAGPATGSKPVGALILGGAHGALAAARSLGRRNIPVAIVSDDFTLVRLSRFISQHFSWSGPAAPNATTTLLELAARHGLQDWLLIPGGDAEVRLIAENREALRAAFRVMSCGWADLEAVCNKRLLAERAAAVDIASPRNYRIASEAAATTLELQFPVVLKPAQREAPNVFTLAKAWRADSREEFVARYREAAAAVGHDQVVVQELVPGGGATQFSYVALWQGGKPLAQMTARRTRQYPVDFSYTSTFVEVVQQPEVSAAAQALLASINFEGLVEIEFKYDTRDKLYKVLDVNPRCWTWFGLGEAAGVDFAWLMFCAANGNPAPASVIDDGQKWIYVVRDAIASLRLMARGDLSWSDYRASWRGPMTWAAFAADDPVPGLLEMPLTLYRVLTKRLPLQRRKPVAQIDPDARRAGV